MKVAVIAGWSDVPHLDEKAKADMLATYPPWQRDARTKGIPMLGAGAVYQVPESEFVVTPFSLPPDWPRCFALDVGWKRNAALWAAVDRNTETVYLYDEMYLAKTEASVVAAGIKKRGEWIFGVVDPASRGRSQHDGQSLMQIYTDLGLTLEPAKNDVQAGLTAVWELLSQGRLKVFRNLSNFLAEYRIYRRDEKGNIVKSNDHLMDALRYLVMSGLERAIVEPKALPKGSRLWERAGPSVFAG